MRRILIAAIAAAMAVSAAAAGGPGSAPEPEGLWTGPLASYTPSTLKGADVVDAVGVEALVKAGAVLFDVGPEDRRPETLPANAVWLPQHRTVPGSVWLPGAGPGDLPPKVEAALKDRILAVTAGRLDTPVVTFCKPDCWGSWNLGKRLLGWGFTNVSWFPEGVNGWMEADRPTAVVKADPAWMAAAKDAAEGRTQ